MVSGEFSHPKSSSKLLKAKKRTRNHNDKIFWLRYPSMRRLIELSLPMLAPILLDKQALKETDLNTRKRVDLVRESSQNLRKQDLT